MREGAQFEARVQRGRDIGQLVALYFEGLDGLRDVAIMAQVFIAPYFPGLKLLAKMNQALRRSLI
ncbi:hypothetical protein A3742_32565 [Oleiphilus sp. HI0071]|nr:hypothetical protein A3742_32565 [Oleiphilus sp. HI0071]KZZ64226.1 hypothetical protein A3765_07270 [Oleiphilus sp. HI0130]KZZ76953.1 hypothetical protein A3767_20475 [Oleiphilus sp. HI0133]